MYLSRIEPDPTRFGKPLLAPQCTRLPWQFAATPENGLMISSRNMGEPTRKSKKQSAGNGPIQSLPEEFVLFLEENLRSCQPLLNGAGLLWYQVLSVNWTT